MKGSNHGMMGFNMSLRVLAAAFLLLVLLMGCSFQHPLSVKDDSFVRGNVAGVIVLSVRRPFYGITRPTPTYRIKGLDQTFVTSITKYSKSAASFGTIESGFVETLQLPQGRYEVYNWDLFFNTGLAQWHERSIVSFSIPFRVEPGKVTYLGEIALDDYAFQFRNMLERDMAITLEQHPFLKGAEMVYHPLSCTPPCTVPHSQVGTKDVIVPVPLPIKK